MILAALGLLIGVAVLGFGTAHADPYEELGPTICMAIRQGETISQLADQMVEATRRDPGPKGPVTHDQAVQLVTVMVNAYCPELLMVGSGR
jgi:hypothetical protein